MGGGVASAVVAANIYSSNHLRKKYLPQGLPTLRGAGARIYFFLCPDFPGLPLGPLLRPRFSFPGHDAQVRRFVVHGVTVAVIYVLAAKCCCPVFLYCSSPSSITSGSASLLIWTALVSLILHLSYCIFSGHLRIISYPSTALLFTSTASPLHEARTA